MGTLAQFLVEPPFDASIGWLIATVLLIPLVVVSFFESCYSRRLALFVPTMVGVAAAVIYFGVHFMALLFDMEPVDDDVSFFKFAVVMTVLFALFGVFNCGRTLLRLIQGAET